MVSDLTVWDGVVVSPLDPCYEKPPERKEGEEEGEDMEAEAGNGDDAMETADNA
jgi:interleukin enhancer-binding factor 2